MLLAGDIGGTKTDLAVFSPEAGPRAPLVSLEYQSADYPSLAAMARDFVARVRLPIEWACFDVAGPVINGRAKVTNLSWVVDEAVLRDELNLKSVTLLNDLEAVARAVPTLQPGDLRTLNAGRPLPGGAIAVVAPGTGLGEAFLTWDGSRYIAHASEGGHADFAPTTPLQSRLLEYLRHRYDHVSVERVCSGLGIPNLYHFIRDSGCGPELTGLAEQIAAAPDPTPLIVDAALGRPQRSELCAAALDLFVSILGAEAGNLALKVMATGGTYLSGGIPKRVLPALENGRFMRAFVYKGRLSGLLAGVPVHVVVEQAALIGAASFGLELARQNGEWRT
jgi:glucokinase